MHVHEHMHDVEGGVHREQWYAIGLVESRNEHTGTDEEEYATNIPNEMHVQRAVLGNARWQIVVPVFRRD